MRTSPDLLPRRDCTREWARLCVRDAKRDALRLYAANDRVVTGDSSSSASPLGRRERTKPYSATGSSSESSSLSSPAREVELARDTSHAWPFDSREAEVIREPVRSSQSSSSGFLWLKKPRVKSSDAIDLCLFPWVGRGPGVTAPLLWSCGLG